MLGVCGAGCVWTLCGAGAVRVTPGHELARNGVEWDSGSVDKTFPLNALPPDSFFSLGKTTNTSMSLTL